VLHLDHLKQDCEYSLTVGVVELASFATTGYPDVFIACRSMAFDGPSREFRTFSIDKGRITPRCHWRVCTATSVRSVATAISCTLFWDELHLSYIRGAPWRGAVRDLS
jgi:hypothetical protein